MTANVARRPKVPKRHLTLTVPAHDELSAARDQLAIDSGEEVSFSDTVRTALRELARAHGWTAWGEGK